MAIQQDKLNNKTTNFSPKNDTSKEGAKQRFKLRKLSEGFDTSTKKDFNTPVLKTLKYGKNN
jgi:hypothetical protein